LVLNSGPSRSYEPEPSSGDAWEEAYDRFLSYCRSPTAEPELGLEGGAQ
jgi:hypothetical protein